MKKLLVFAVFFLGVVFLQNSFSAEMTTTEKEVVEKYFKESRESSGKKEEKGEPASIKKPAQKTQPRIKPKIKPKTKGEQKTRGKNKKTSEERKKEGKETFERTTKTKTTTTLKEELPKPELKKVDPCDEVKMVITSFSLTGNKKEKEKDMIEMFGVVKSPKDIQVMFEYGINGEFAPTSGIPIKGGERVSQIHAPTSPLIIGNWYGARMVTELSAEIKCYSKEVPFRIAKETPIAREKEYTPSVFFVPSDGHHGGFSGVGYNNYNRHSPSPSQNYTTTTTTTTAPASPPPVTPVTPSTPVAPSGKPGLDPPAHR